MKKSTLYVIITLALFFGLANSSVEANGKIIYTETRSDQSVGAGTQYDPYRDLQDAVKAANDGDTIVVLSNGAFVNDRLSNDAPLIIDKAITIQGESGTIPSIDLRSGGIVLSDNVTFKNVSFGFTSFVNPGIFANGHTLNLENTTQTHGTRPIDLHAGGLYKDNVLYGVEGNDGQIIVSGSSTRINNVYAGAKGGDYNGDATISLTGTFSTVGEVYGSGVEMAPVKGEVLIYLTNNNVKHVNGLADRSAGTAASVAYSSQYLRTTSFENIYVLRVDEGTLQPNELTENTILYIENGAALDLSTVTAKNNNSYKANGIGGNDGTLKLGKLDKLTVSGETRGVISFQVAGTLSGSAIAEENHDYIDVIGANPDHAIFTFTPHTTQQDMTLVKKDKVWTTVVGDQPVKIVSHPQDQTIEEGYVTAPILTVEAEGENLSYQWYELSDTSDEPIQGATSKSYTIPEGKTAGMYYYYVVVTSGGYSGVSEAAAVEITSVTTPTTPPEPEPSVVTPPVVPDPDPPIAPPGSKPVELTQDMVKLEGVTDSVYDGRSKRPSVIVTVGEKLLKENTDYTVTYNNSTTGTNDLISAGDINVTITGAGNYAGTVIKSFTIQPYKITSRDLEFANSAITKQYDGGTNGTAIVQIKAGVLGNKSPIIVPGTVTFNSPNVKDANSVTFAPAVIHTSNYVLEDTITIRKEASITRKVVEVTANNHEKFYGQLDPVLTYQVTGMVGNEKLVGALTRNAGETFSVYNVSQGTLTNENNPNYNIQFKPNGAVLRIKETTPQLVLTTDRATQVVGQQVRVTTKITNPYNNTLADLPHVETSYVVGGIETKFMNTFTVPSTAKAGETIIVKAVTNGTAGMYTPNNTLVSVTVGSNVTPPVVALPVVIPPVTIPPSDNHESVPPKEEETNTPDTITDGSNDESHINAISKLTDLAKESWYMDAVEFVIEKGIMMGTSDTSFSPDLTTSRGMLAVILYRLEGSPTVSGDMPFKDVHSKKYYADAIKWAAQKGIVNGYRDGTFNPEAPITREELVSMLWKYKGAPLGYEQSLNFKDAKDIKGWSKEAFSWAVQNNIISGDNNGNVLPKGQATRVQVAQIIMNLLKD